VAERNNRHGLCCVTVTPRSKSAGRPWFTRLFFTGGVDPDDPHNPKDNRDHAGMVFFRDVFGVWLSKTWVKALVMILYGKVISSLSYLVAMFTKHASPFYSGVHRFRRLGCDTDS